MNVQFTATGCSIAVFASLLLLDQIESNSDGRSLRATVKLSNTATLDCIKEKKIDVLLCEGVCVVATLKCKYYVGIYYFF